MNLPKTILIAASDPNIAYLLKRYAETSGFETVGVVEQADLVEVAKQKRPDLIVFAIELPETPARSLMLQLKADATTAIIPVVVYSCYDEITYTQSDGAAICLQKSAMYSDFLAALEQAGVQPG